MKFLVCSFFSLIFFVSGQAQIIKTVSAGDLQFLSPLEKSTTEQLILKGSIDARDFQIMRDSMPRLRYVDLLQTRIIAFNGLGGTVLSDTNVVYPANTVPSHAFIDNATIVSLYLPSSASVINDYAFAGCTALTHIYMPNTLQRLGARAFEFDTSLRHVTIPSAVMQIEEGCFAACRRLDSISLPQSLHSIGASAFEQCKALRSIQLGSKLKEIGMSAFMNCVSLQKISLPASLQSIGQSAFYACKSLDVLQINNPTPLPESLLGENVFYGLSEQCVLYVPYLRAKEYANAPIWQLFAGRTSELPGFSLSKDTVYLSANAVFDTIQVQSNCKWRVSCSDAWLHLRTSEAQFTDNCIFRCEANYSNLRQGLICCVNESGDSLLIHVIQKSAPFALRMSAGTLRDVLGDSLLHVITSLQLFGTVNARDFKIMRDSMPQLRSVDLSLVSIVPYVGLLGTDEEITYAANTVPPNSFSNKADLQNVLLPSNIESIEHDAFADCRNVLSFHLPKSVNFIGDRAFSHCTALKYMKVENPIPLKNNEMGDMVFRYTNTGSCVLSVPYSSLLDYSVTKQWSQFLNIEPLWGLSVVPSSISVSGKASHTSYLLVHSNTAWTARSKSSWISLSKTSGAGTDMVYLNIEQNTSFERDAEIDFFCSDTLKQTVKLHQASIPLQLDCVAGGLAGLLNTSNLRASTHLIVSGSIDARDFKTMRDSMPFLRIINLSGLQINEYSGALGTDTLLMAQTYQANTVPRCAFYHKSTLQLVYLPPMLASVGQFAFAYCELMTECAIPAQTITIEQNAFCFCRSLLMLTLPSSVQSIGEYAFANCLSLSHLSIGSNVVQLGAQSFANCSALQHISVAKADPLVGVDMGESVFRAVDTAHCVLEVPFNTASNYKEALQWKDFSHINETSSYRYQVYPNPSKYQFAVECEGPVVVRVYTANGKLVLQQNITREINIPIDSWAAGCYRVCIDGALGTQCLGFIKE